MVSTGTRAESGSGAKETNQGIEQGQAHLGASQEHPSRSLAIARRGVRTGEDFANLMSALMSDVIEGGLTPDIANAVVNAGGKLLKVVEMQYRFGKQQEHREPSLVLASGDKANS